MRNAGGYLPARAWSVIRLTRHPPLPPEVVPVRGAGLSFGNSRTFTGLRFNLRDHELRTIRGMSVTLRVPGHDPHGLIQGLSAGLGVGSDDVAGVGLTGGFPRIVARRPGYGL